ncbi:hypothetical protein [Empedobacter brevis]|uniref:hypothetical protein n=1 Tax=Empedobacter brevis TaxID=247 RepID=UPI00289709DF|nr:hypothetical protein [Empedobacter brevis]
MYIGTTTKGRLTQFIVLEKGDSAEALSILMTEKNNFNLIVSGKEADLDILADVAFSEVFRKIKILHLTGLELHKSEELFL